jgi:tetratricopeptide (TPR) repeat protein
MRLPARFRPERSLGRGSQRNVYLARDTDLDRWVAVSVFDTRALSPADLERIRLVHAVAGSGAHPHVLPIEPVIQSEASLFMVSPFLAGGDLASRLEQGGGKLLLITETLRIAAQLCRALESIHGIGISHRDVKPGNVLLDERGDAFLCDFGLAVNADPGAHSSAAGTPAYAAPELIANPPGGTGADLYSLGCLLYELTTGRPPFVGESASEVLLQHQAGRPVPPVERNAAIPRVLSELILKLLEKQPGARPASAGDVRAALEGMLRSPSVSAATDPEVPGSDSRRSPLLLPLVGRQRELDALETALAQVGESIPALVVISSEPGGGKSRLLAELCARAEARGCTVLMGGGNDLRTPSYQPFADALLPLAGRFGELPAVHGDLLRDFLYRGQDADQLDRLTPHGVERERLFASAFAALAAFSKSTPLVLLFEDLHAFDPASIELFDHLASALLAPEARRDLALLVVATTRPPTDERLGSLLASLRAAGCGWLDLAPLDEPAIFDLLVELGPERRPSGRLCHKVVRATHGNPLFVREVVHRLRGAVLREPESATVAGEPWDVEFELPPSVGHAIAERVAGLPSSCRELLSFAALLGSRFERARLELVSEFGQTDFARSLDQASAEGLLLDDGVACAFAHPLMLQVIRDQIAARDRRRLHFRIARRLLDSAGGESEIPAIEVAHHLVQSGSLADPTELARIAGRAGHQALARFAWSDAAELLEGAIDAARRGAKLDARAVAELHRNAGLAYFRLIDERACLSHYDAAIAAFERVQDDSGLARTLNDRVRIASLLGLSYGDLGKREPLEVAVGRLGPAESTLRIQILTTLAESYWCAGQLGRAEQLGIEALALAGHAGDHRLCADASISIGMARFIDLRVEDACSTWQAGAAYARRAGDPIEEQRCLVRSSLALTATARFDEALDAVQTVQGLHRVLHLQNEMSLASGVLLAIATMRGDFAAAELHGADALDRVRRVGYGWGTVLCAPALACARALQNDVAGAISAIQCLFEPGMGFADPSSYRATARCLTWLSHWYAGDLAAIDVREIEALLPEVKGQAHLNALMVACALVELADALQAPSLAEPVGGLLAVAQRHGFVFACSWPFFVPRLRGVAAVLAGRFELAEEQLSSAIAIAERVGAGIEVARSRLDLARLLATRNADGDRGRARTLVRTCRSALAHRGPAVFFERADRLHAFLEGAQDESSQGGRP